MKKSVTALICALALFGAQSAVAGSGKGVETRLVPNPPIVEVKPLPPKKECRTVERKTVSTEQSHLYSIQPMLFENCGCCGGTTQTYMQGTNYYRPEQRINGSVITTECE